MRIGRDIDRGAINNNCLLPSRDDLTRVNTGIYFTIKKLPQFVVEPFDQTGTDDGNVAAALADVVVSHSDGCLHCCCLCFVLCHSTERIHKPFLIWALWMRAHSGVGFGSMNYADFA